MACRGDFMGSVVAALVSLSCSAVKGSEIHLIPENYVGPVVILYGAAGGVDPERDESGALVYRIPPDGVLHLKARAPAAGFYNKKHYYEASDGTRIRLPYEAGPSTLQVFGAEDGVTEMLDGVRLDGQRSNAYIIGVPNARDDWARLREKAREDAVRALTQECRQRHPKQRS